MPLSLTLCRPSQILNWRDAAKVCDKEEHNRADRFAYEHLRRRFICGRAMLRHVLAESQQINPCDVRIDKTPKGQLTTNTNISISLSYSEDLVGVLAGDGPLGLDLEYLDRTNDLRGVAGHAFRPEERETLMQLHGDDERQYFFRVWCEKEAVSKAMGIGMGVGFNTFDARAAATTFGTRVDTFPLFDRYLACVVAPVDAPRVSIAHWNGTPTLQQQ